MSIEIEAHFTPLGDRDVLRARLAELGFVCTQPRRKMSRTVFWHPLLPENGFVRVRDEWDRVTLTLKEIERVQDIHGVSEWEVTVSDYDQATNLLKHLWLQQKSVQETYRETWSRDDCECMMDEWPWLTPFLEIEAQSEACVRKYAELLWYDYSQALFGSTAEIAFRELGIPHDVLNALPSITFENPLLPYTVSDRSENHF